MMSRPSTRGFSLLELLVVIMIIGLVAGVVAASFSGGIRVWESASLLTRVEQEVYFSVEIMRRDIASTFSFYGLGFKGESSQLSFPGLVPVFDDSGGTRFMPGTVKYLYRADDRTLRRLTWRYPGAEDNAAGEVIAEGIESLNISYLKPASRDADDWLNAWNSPTNFPAAIRFELSVSNRVQALVIEREVPLLENLWREE